MLGPFHYVATTYPHADGSWSGYVLREPERLGLHVEIADLRAGFLNERGAETWAQRRAEEITATRKAVA